MIIANILRTKGGAVLAVGPEDDTATIVRTLSQHRIGAVLVRDAAGAVLGIVSERDIVRALAAAGGDPAGRAAPGDGLAGMTAQGLMTRVLHTVGPRTLIIEALAMMTDRRVRHLPVLDEDGALAGMVSIGDLVKARIEQVELETSELRNYVATAG